MSESPAHYSKFAIQPIEFIEGGRIPFSLGNVVKYVLRGKADDDIKKALHYIDLYGQPHRFITSYEFSEANKLSATQGQILRVILTISNNTAYGRLEELRRLVATLDKE